MTAVTAETTVTTITTLLRSRRNSPAWRLGEVECTHTRTRAMRRWQHKGTAWLMHPITMPTQSGSRRVLRCARWGLRVSRPLHTKHRGNGCSRLPIGHEFLDCHWARLLERRVDRYHPVIHAGPRSLGHFGIGRRQSEAGGQEHFGVERSTRKANAGGAAGGGRRDETLQEITRGNHCHGFGFTTCQERA